jgi:hypothetical protein
MRISERTRFPHPILGVHTGDYVIGDFSISLKVGESRTTGNVTVEYQVELTEPHVHELVDNSSATIGVYIVCLRTYYNQLHHLERQGGSIEFEKGELHDTVVFRPVICAAEQIADFSSENLHEEFGDSAWSFQPADVLAIGDEVIIEVGLDKLAPMETIFTLVVSEDVPDGQTRAYLSGDKIAVAANKKTRDLIHGFRGSGIGQLTLLNAVYLPVIMEVLAALAEDSGPYEQYRWYSVFMGKCNHLGINIEQPDFLGNAQTLLQSPLGKLLASREFKDL